MNDNGTEGFVPHNVRSFLIDFFKKSSYFFFFVVLFSMWNWSTKSNEITTKFALKKENRLCYIIICILDSLFLNEKKKKFCFSTCVAKFLDWLL
jgi:hypothetical protein